jgi:hypothetical protein
MNTPHNPLECPICHRAHDGNPPCRCELPQGLTWEDTNAIAAVVLALEKEKINRLAIDPPIHEATTRVTDAGGVEMTGLCRCGRAWPCVMGCTPAPDKVTGYEITYNGEAELTKKVLDLKADLAYAKALLESVCAEAAKNEVHRMGQLERLYYGLRQIIAILEAREIQGSVARAIAVAKSLAQ